MHTVLVIHSDLAINALPWAARIARQMQQPLRILVLSADPQGGLQLATTGAEDNPELVRKVFAALEEAQLAPAEVYDCRGYRLRRAALNALAELDAGFLVLHDALDGEKRQERGLVRDLAHAAPVDTLVLDVETPSGRPERVFFAQVRGGGTHGMRIALRAFCDAQHPLLVIPDPEAAARSRRAFEKVKEGVNRQRAAALQLLDAPDSMDSLIADAPTARDLVLVDSENPGRVNARLKHLQKLRDEHPDAAFTIGVTRANDLAAPGMFERLLESFHRHVPKLDRDSRRRIATDLERGGSLSADFIIMLMLSAAIAALGLVQNSTAVVIGGMLVAPLMTPMLATGLALIQGNVQQFRASLRAMGFGIGGALLAAMLVGLLSPWSDLSSEVVARGAPNLFDLGIALLSGIAAAYALARPGLAGTLVGVAVAVALVPPLCAVGIALVKFHFNIALGAAVLFITNLLAIILGAALVFRLFGLDISLRGNRAPVWVRATMLALGIMLVPVGGVLFANLETQIHEGVQRNYSRPLPPSLRDAIEARVNQSAGTEVLIMEQSGIERDFDMHIALVVHGETDPALEDDLLRLIAKEVRRPHQASIMLLKSAGASPAAAGASIPEQE